MNKTEQEINKHIEDTVRTSFLAILLFAVGVAVGILLANASAQDYTINLNKNNTKAFMSVVECVKTNDSECEAINMEAYVAK